ncbi:metabotropic glutamate receptor-like [Glandiceps talaboti]
MASWLFWIFFAITSCTATHLPDTTTQTYSKPGDIVLAGLFSIHEYDGGHECGDLRELGPLLKMEAMAFAVDQINQRSDILPNITIGYQMYDDCGFDEMAMFIAMSLSHRTLSCHDVNTGVSDEINIVGVVGAEWSSTSIPSNKILNLLHIPQISYYATSDELSDKKRFPFFLRTVPPDKMQAQAIADLILHFGWTYISIIHSDESYGRNGINFLTAEVAKRGICVAASLQVSRFDSDAELGNVVTTLRKHSNAKVVVVFSIPLHANLFLKAVRRVNATSEFIWIGSDGWGPNLHLYGNLHAAVGGFFIRFYSQEVPEFEKYFKSLTPSTHYDNPWFESFWGSYLNCTVSNSCLQDPYIAGFSETSFVSLVIDAVYTFAHALESWRRVNCSDASLPCAELDHITAQDTIEYLKSVDFEGETGHISFDSNGDIRGKYVFKILEEKDNMYDFVTFGSWDARKDVDKLEVHNDSIHWRLPVDDTGVPKSRCSEPCLPGYYQRFGVTPCCWECFKCDEDEISINGSKCDKCPDLWWPNDNFTACEPMPSTYLHWNDALGISLVTLASFGTVTTSIIAALYIKHREKTLIKASSRELSVMILIGALLCYIMVYIFIGKPNYVTCVMCRLGFTLSCIFLYAPLFIKVNRIYRIFKAGKKSTKPPRLVSPTSQVAIASILIVTQVIISVVFVIYEPTGVVAVKSASDRTVELLCNIPTSEIITSSIYNLTLIALCCFYAVKTRHLPDNYNESQFIALCVYTTLVVSLAFMPTYFAINDGSMRVVILSLAIMLNATIALVFLYVPKVYVVHFVRNTNVNIGVISSVYHPQASTSSRVAPTT